MLFTPDVGKSGNNAVAVQCCRLPVKQQLRQLSEGVQLTAYIDNMTHLEQCLMWDSRYQGRRNVEIQILQAELERLLRLLRQARPGGKETSFPHKCPEVRSHLDLRAQLISVSGTSSHVNKWGFNTRNETICAACRCRKP